jgi:hypothetical protein
MEIDLGFGRYALEEEAKPKVQIISTQPTLEPKDRIYYCSKCNNILQWIEQPANKYVCYQCSLTYSEADTPLISIDQSIRPLQSVENTEKPVFISFKPNTRLQGQHMNNNVQVSGTLQRARIHVNGSPLLATEALIRKEFEEYGY